MSDSDRSDCNRRIGRPNRRCDCGGLIQWHPQSEDFGLCSECGADYGRDTPFQQDVLHRHSHKWPRRLDLGDLTALLFGVALGIGIGVWIA